MSVVEELLAEGMRLGWEWDVVHAALRLAESRAISGNRAPELMEQWDRALAEQDEVMAAIRANSRALRLAVRAA